jgi:hypothetical protein
MNIMGMQFTPKGLHVAFAAIAAGVATSVAVLHQKNTTGVSSFESAVSLRDLPLDQQEAIPTTQAFGYWAQHGTGTGLATEYAFIEMDGGSYPAIADRNVNCDGNGLPAYRLWGNYQDLVVHNRRSRVRPSPGPNLDLINPSTLIGGSEYAFGPPRCYDSSVIYPFGLIESDSGFVGPTSEPGFYFDRPVPQTQNRDQKSDARKPSRYDGGGI